MIAFSDIVNWDLLGNSFLLFHLIILYPSRHFFVTSSPLLRLLLFDAIFSYYASLSLITRISGDGVGPSAQLWQGWALGDFSVDQPATYD